MTFSNASPVSGSAKPRLPRGVRLVNNPAQGGWMLLAPERVFKVDTIAAAILQRCTGEIAVDGIVDDLASIYSAPRERVAADVAKMIGMLADKQLLEL